MTDFVTSLDYEMSQSREWRQKRHEEEKRRRFKIYARQKMSPRMNQDIRGDELGLLNDAGSNWSGYIHGLMFFLGTSQGQGRASRLPIAKLRTKLVDSRHQNRTSRSFKAHFYFQKSRYFIIWGLLYLKAEWDVYRSIRRYLGELLIYSSHQLNPNNQVNAWNKNNKSLTPMSKDKTHDASDNN